MSSPETKLTRPTCHKRKVVLKTPCFDAMSIMKMYKVIIIEVSKDAWRRALGLERIGVD
jgi:hypothetical protein